jgi:hypothetical protein
MRPAPVAPVTYVDRRDGRRVMLVRPGPSIEPHLLGVESVLPSQVPRRSAIYTTGTRALFARVLALALYDAGWPFNGCTPRVVPTQHPVRWQTQRTLAVRWLCGELDAEVTVPVRLVCDVLGIDADALAAAVRRGLPQVNRD